MTKGKPAAAVGFPKSLRDLERALAEVQYAATVAAPFSKDAAAESLKTLESIKNQLSDLAAFIKRQPH
jgi:hypothetical protein